jgi:uncharacterized membrane protein
MNMPDTPVSIITTTSGHGILWFRNGYRLFMQSPINWLVMCIVFVLGIFILSSIPLLSQLVQIAVPGVTAGLMLAASTLHRGEHINPGYLLAGFRRNRNELLLLGVFNFIANTVIMILTAILLSLFTDAATLQSIITSINNIKAGSMPDEKMLNDLLLLVMILAALSLPLVMALWFSPALIVLNNMKAWDAFKLSFRACNRNLIPFLIYGLVGAGLLILASLPFGLGLLVFIPVMICSMYWSWHDVFGPNKTEPLLE